MELINKKECTGCGSCFNICPQNCITMEADREGFQYPTIDSNRCIKCHRCERACPVLNEDEKNKQNIAFAAINTDVFTRISSSSGGIFPILAKVILQQGGYVCGAIFDEEFMVVHKFSNEEFTIVKMSGAKYVQSDSWKYFKEIKQKLEKNIKVLFVGTPCQVAGLKKYLHKGYDNLILVDMICHGVPSPMIWKHYVKERRKIDASGAEISKIELRNKDSGWSKYKYSVKFLYKNSISYCMEQCSDGYMRGFVNNLFLRPSCAKCKFKGIDRYSDITLGDYWGVWDQYPEFDDNQGTSLVLLHTEKGMRLWHGIENKVQRIQVDIKKALEQNPSALQSSVPHKNRTIFFEKYNETESVIKQIEKQLEICNKKSNSLGRKIANKLLKWRRK